MWCTFLLTRYWMRRSKLAAIFFSRIFRWFVDETLPLIYLSLSSKTRFWGIPIEEKSHEDTSRGQGGHKASPNLKMRRFENRRRRTYSITGSEHLAEITKVDNQSLFFVTQGWKTIQHHNVTLRCYHNSNPIFFT